MSVNLSNIAFARALAKNLTRQAEDAGPDHGILLMRMAFALTRTADDLEQQDRARLDIQPMKPEP